MSIEHDPTGPASSSVERYCPSCERSYVDRDRCPTDGTQLVSLTTAEDALIGRDVDGRFTIEARLGAGGMGTVYRAVQHSVGRPVAIKIVNPRLVSDPLVIKRFLREAKLTSRLSHPHAVAVLDFGQTRDGLFYLVMELLEGRTLRQVLEADGRFGLERLSRVGGQICEALEGAHRLAIVHRDLKPSNIMILDGPAGGDLVKVLDFGLAKSLSTDTTSISTVTSSGALLGTPAYMPPEAALGLEVDARADLYSLGVILYQLASGRMPFTATTVHELVAKHAHESPPSLTGVPVALVTLVDRLLAKDPAARPESAAAVQAALAEVARDARAERGAASGPDAFGDTLSSAGRAPRPAPAPRRRGAWIVGAAIAVGLVVAAWIVAAQRETPSSVAPAPALSTPPPPPAVDPAPAPPPAPAAAVVPAVDAGAPPPPRRPASRRPARSKTPPAAATSPDAGAYPW